MAITGQKLVILLNLLIITLLNISNVIAGEKDGINKVVIDAGHGGVDPGAVGKKYYEKNITLSVAMKLGKYINENFPEVEVIYTRKEDIFIPLNERAEIANKAHADLFISIHANANVNNLVSGAETYVMGIHTNEKNLEVAMKENAVITFEKDYETKYEGYDPNSAESFIIFSLMQNNNLEQSLQLASYLQTEFREKAKRTDRGVKQAGFLVLWRTSMPSILTEIGFISNLLEEEYIGSEEGQDYLASAIYRSFKKYKLGVESKTGIIPNSGKDSKVKPEKQNEKNQIVDSAKTASVIKHDTILKQTTLIRDNSIPIVRDIVFRIQVSSATQPTPLNTAYFAPLKELKEVDKIHEYQTSSHFKYLVGNEKSYIGAQSLLNKLKLHYKDAFIVATENNKIVPLTNEMKNK